jgi:hypothetical protein
MLVTIFYHVDEFCKVLEATLKANVVTEKKQRAATIPILSLSEIITICIYYHYSGYKNFKSYYKNEVLVHMKTDFTKSISYNRFIELKKNAVLPLALFLKIYCKANCTGISFIDSFAIKVCHNRRIHSHKVFKNLARRGQTSMGWFYGFKVHFIISHVGEIMNFYITPGNVSDNNTNLLKKLTDNIIGKLFGDKGYIINQEFSAELYKRGLQIITKIRKNMKNILMDMGDKLLLRKRGTIESSIGILKESFGIEHSRHRSPANFLCHIFSALTAYCFKENKPSIVRSDLLIEQFA